MFTHCIVDIYTLCYPVCNKRVSEVILNGLQYAKLVMDYELSGSTDTLSNNSLGIPDQQNTYITYNYFVLVYQLASTAYIIGMGSLIISTIQDQVIA